MAKSWILIFVMTILQLKTSKTQITTDIKALIFHRLYGSVAKRIKHTASNIFTCRETISNLVRSSLGRKSPQHRLHKKFIHYRLL